MTNALPLRCFAHRGGRGHGIENTLAAIDKSLALGVCGIEIDVWWVGGEILVTHDRWLGRVIRGAGRLLDVPEEQIQYLLNNDHTPVPRLWEVLALVGDRALLNIELKGPQCAQPVAELLDSFCQQRQVPSENYIISSFDHQQLAWLQHHAPHYRRGVLVAGIPLDYAACGDALGAYSFHPNMDFISPPLIADALARNLKVFVYTVNDREDFLDLYQLGVTGVFTDFPETLIAFNEEMVRGER